MTSTKAVMVSLKCFPTRSSKDKGHRVHVHRECLQDRQETIGQYLPALLLHLDLYWAHLGDLPLASESNECCRLQNRRKLMSQEWRTYPHCWRFPTMHMIQMFRERRFVRLGWCRGKTPSQPEANQILPEAIWQKDGAGQL
jgi:hypothetical protein